MSAPSIDAALIDKCAAQFEFVVKLLSTSTSVKRIGDDGKPVGRPISSRKVAIEECALAARQLRAVLSGVGK